jgi:uncharacterized protein YbjQ (UPF0145 family)
LCYILLKLDIIFKKRLIISSTRLFAYYDISFNYNNFNEHKGETNMILVNIDHIPGKKVDKVFGVVKGSTVHSKHIGKDILAGLRTIIGGEIAEYTQMLDEARQVAVSRMVKDAESMGANAILNIRFASSAVMQNAAELVAYGTAVLVNEE